MVGALSSSLPCTCPLSCGGPGHKRDHLQQINRVQAYRHEKTFHRQQLCPPTAAVGSNLGELERLAQAYPGEPALQPSTLPYVPEVHVDVPAIAISLIVFLLLTAIGANRILGLTPKLKQLMAEIKESRAYKQRNDIIDARRSLESLLSDSEGDGEGDDGEGGDRSRTAGK